jgi:hypothetical protein
MIIVVQSSNNNPPFKIETWAIGDVMQPREGVVSMEEYVLNIIPSYDIVV